MDTGHFTASERVVKRSRTLDHRLVKRYDDSCGENNQPMVEDNSSSPVPNVSSPCVDGVRANAVIPLRPLHSSLGTPNAVM